MQRPVGRKHIGDIGEENAAHDLVFFDDLANGNEDEKSEDEGGNIKKNLYVATAAGVSVAGPATHLLSGLAASFTTGHRRRQEPACFSVGIHGARGTNTPSHMTKLLSLGEDWN